MLDFLSQTGGVVSEAGMSIVEVVILGPLLILSITGNVVLVWSLVRCWRAKSHLRDKL